MKILFICQYYYPEQFKINDICNELVKQGYNITVLTGLPNYPNGVIDEEYKKLDKRKEIINGVKVIRSWIIERGQGNFKLALNYLSFVISASFKSLFIKKDFDLIITYQLSPITMTIPGILLKKITKKPLILYCFDLWPESIVSGGISKDSIIYKFLLKMSKWIYRKADKLIVSSKGFKEYFNSIIGINDGITYLPTYAETLFNKVDNIKDENVNFLFAGNIGEMQSVETIIYAAHELKEEKNIKFHIVGDGSSREKCEKLSVDLGLNNVTFYGHRPLTEMPNFYRIADVFLVTLKENKNISYTLPGKVQSYMAAAKPIIGAVDGETSVVINEAKCGFCSSPGDYKELANNIKTISKEEEGRYIFYGKNARKYYDNNFSKNIFMKRFNKIIKKQINGDEIYV